MLFWRVKSLFYSDSVIFYIYSQEVAKIQILPSWTGLHLSRDISFIHFKWAKEFNVNTWSFGLICSATAASSLAFPL